jgi:hypothetical protein
MALHIRSLWTSLLGYGLDDVEFESW